MLLSVCPFCNKLFNFPFSLFFFSVFFFFVKEGAVVITEPN
uniref:Uncharacterized protein n=1 Tax=Rhizophora mucronata TaxID=61149 RepID=A0A2P2R307_RHIMU